MRLKRQPAEKSRKKAKGLLVGLGLDGKDGHLRVTSGANFRLIGGSKETHERMQEKAIRFNEALSKFGKELGECSNKELVEIAREAKLLER